MRQDIMISLILWAGKRCLSKYFRLPIVSLEWCSEAVTWSIAIFWGVQYLWWLSSFLLFWLFWVCLVGSLLLEANTLIWISLSRPAPPPLVFYYIYLLAKKDRKWILSHHQSNSNPEKVNISSTSLPYIIRLTLYLSPLISLIVLKTSSFQRKFLFVQF